MRSLLATLACCLVTVAATAGEGWEPGGGVEAPTEHEQQGRDVFRAEMCWTCHGPQARGHAVALERPTVPKTKDWLLAHLFAPRLMSAASPMPGSPALFDGFGRYAEIGEVQPLITRFDKDGDGRVSFTTDAAPSWAENAMEVSRMSDLDRAGLRAPDRSELQTRTGEEFWPDGKGRRAYIDRWMPGAEQGDGILSPRDMRPPPSTQARALVAYVRALETPRSLPSGDAIDKEAVHAFLAAGGRLTPRATGGGTMRARLDPPARVRPEVAAEGAHLYVTHCASCHGSQGRGDGPAARFLDAPPTDLAKGRFKYRSTATGQRPVLADLYRTIRRGLPGSSMRGMSQATPAQVWAVTFHVRALWGLQTPDSAPLVAPPVPAMRLARKADQAGYMAHVRRGKALFVAFECSRCHGVEGRGDGPDAIVEWSDGRHVRARDFKPRDKRDHPRWRLRGGARPEDVWRTIMNGLDKVGMPGVAGELSSAGRAPGSWTVDKPLAQPLKDPRLLGGADHAGMNWPGAGVVASDDGPYVERILALYTGGAAPGEGWKNFGDEWALVLYVLHLARTDDEASRGVMAWPKIEVGR